MNMLTLRCRFMEACPCSKVTVYVDCYECIYYKEFMDKPRNRLELYELEIFNKEFEEEESKKKVGYTFGVGSIPIRKKR